MRVKQSHTAFDTNDTTIRLAVAFLGGPFTGRARAFTGSGDRLDLERRIVITNGTT